MASEVDRTLAALADPARRAIVELLQRQPQRPSEVARRLAVSRPALSRHLRVLREAGLLDERLAEGDARGRVVALRAERLTELRGWLDEVTGFWTAQLAAFQAHVEGRPAPRPRRAPRPGRPRSRR